MDAARSLTSGSGGFDTYKGLLPSAVDRFLCIGGGGGGSVSGMLGETEFEYASAVAWLFFDCLACSKFRFIAELSLRWREHSIEHRLSMPVPTMRKS